MIGALRHLLTRKITLVYFSDGDLFVVGRHPVPEKPEGIAREMIQAREWRWKRMLGRPS